MYAHSTPHAKKTWQTLAEHLLNVAGQCAVFASPFGAKDWGYLAGLLHDVGKASAAFQKRLEGARKSVDHATAGGQLVFDLLHGYGEFLPALAAYAIMGHHGGLPDGGYAQNGLESSTLRNRREKSLEDFSRWRQAVPEPPLPAQALPRQIEEAYSSEQGFAAAFFIRMLYSCLVDADWLDTERFCSPERFDRRPKAPSIAEISAQFDAFAAQNLHGSATGNPNIQAWRQKILVWCRKAGERKRGAFSLSVPTGGGKTFSSLAFALEHARQHRMSRIIYVIPFTSIIEQNAAEFRRALGPLGNPAVLEHHSSAREPEQNENAENASDMHLAAENWDASLIVTTAVQFFESLFTRSPSRCRKLHNIANSVIILDEAQMLPPPLLAPCVAALRELIRGYGASVVLCTATQPSLWYRPGILESGFEFEDVAEIIPKEHLSALFAAFKRVDVRQEGCLDEAAVAERLRAEPRALVIVNTRKAARCIFEHLGPADGHYHLSAAMYPAHRRRKLDEIRQRLKNGELCRVISTTLIEAGVDIDFPVVYRELTGIDSIAQAAGRCNREGKLTEGGKVYVYSPAQPCRMPFVQRRAKAAGHVLEKYADILGPEAIEAYFDALYTTENLDSCGILKKLEDALTDDDFLRQPAIPFNEIARDFRFITDDTASVVVECPEAVPLLAELETVEDHGDARRILRKLQDYTVQIYSNELRRFHIRENKRFGLFILSGATGYSDELGLMSDAPDLRRAEDNLF